MKMNAKQFFLTSASILLGGILFVYFINQISSFSDGPSAIDIIGQYDETGYPNPNPLYTSNRANNLPSLFSLSISSGQVIDSVNHRLFVSDTGSNRVLVFNLSTGDLLLDHVPDFVLGQNNFYTSTSGATDATLNQPTGLAYHSVDNMLFVVDSTNNRIMVFDVSTITNGESAVNVLGQADFTSIASATTQSGLNGPRDVTLDSTNDLLFVSDVSNNRIAVFDISTIDNGENMVNAVGQYNEADYGAVAPLYTSSRLNNSPNRLGINNPDDVAVYENFSDGYLFVADMSNNRVLVYSLATHHNFFTPDDHIPDYVLGQPNFYSNSSDVSASMMSAPTKLAVDSTSARLFVSDTNNNRILVFDFSLGFTNGMNASYVLGQADFASANPGTSDVNLNSPQGLAYEPTSNILYVADSANNRVLSFNVSTITNGESAVNVLGQADFVSNGSGTTAGTMSNPNGVIFENENSRLFVADSTNNRILVFDLSAITDGEDAVNVLGQADFVSSGNALSQSGVNGPNDVAYFDDNTDEFLYVSDTYNSRVLVFDITDITDGENALRVVGQENFTSASQTIDIDGMSSPKGISINSAEDPHLWVADALFHRITSYQPGDIITNGIDAYDMVGQYDQTSLLDPVPVYTTDRINDAPNMLGLSSPYGQTLDTTGHRLFISDTGNNRVLVFDLSITNTLTDYAPDYVLGQSNFYTNTSGITSSAFNSPRAVVFDDDNDRLFVNDSDSNRIMVFDVSTIVNGESAVNVLGQTDFVSSSSGTTQSKLTTPYSLAYDNTNDYLLVGDYGNSRVMIFNVASITDGENAVDLIGKYDQTNFTDPVPLYTIGADDVNRIGLNTSLGQLIDSVHHRLFISDTNNHRVLVYELDNSDILLDHIPDYVLGQENFYENIIHTNQDSLRYPMGLAYDSVGDRLFVTERDNSRISVFDVASITNGEDAINVLGQANFTSNTTGTTASKFYAPHFIALDESGNRLFVGDTHNRRVLVFDVSTIVDGEDAINVIGQDTFNTSLIATTQNRFNLVTGVAYDPTNNRLFVGDYNNHRVMAFDVASITDGENAINVLGQENFTSNTASLTRDGFETRVFGLAFDDTNQRLFATDTDAHRILTFDVATIVDGEDAVNVIGQGNFTSNTYGTSSSAITSPLSLGFDATNNRLFVGEFDSNHRVMIFDVSDGVGGGSGGGGGVEPAGITVVQTGGNSTVSENGSTDTFTVSLNSNIASNVVVSITASLSGEVIISPTTLTFTKDNWNTPQTITLTGVADGIVDGNKTYNIIISVIDEDSADTYDGIADVVFEISTTDTDVNAPNTPPTNPPTIPENPPVNPPTLPSDKPNTPPTIPNPQPNTPPNTPPTNPPTAPENLPQIPSENPNNPTLENPNDLPNPSNNIPIQTEDQNNNINNITQDIADNIKNTINSPIGNATVQIVLFVGLVAHLSVLGFGALAANPTAFADIGFRLWSSLLYGFGIRKRNRPWGTVYDSVTKQPLDPAYVILKNLEGKEIANAITDIDGRYGFLVDPGVYAMIVRKTHYHFPSEKLSGKSRDELYSDIYWGDYFEIKKQGDVIIRNIPLDREGFDWNEFTKNEQGRMRFFKKRDVLLGKLADICFAVGFTVSSFAVLNNMSKYNIAIFTLYSVLFLLRFVGINKNKKGKAIYKENGEPLSFGIMRIFGESTGQEIAHKVLDGLGNYFCLIPNGKYTVSLEKKNPDESYTKVYNSEVIEVEGGLLRKNFKI